MERVPISAGEWIGIPFDPQQGYPRIELGYCRDGCCEDPAHLKRQREEASEGRNAGSAVRGPHEGLARPLGMEKTALS